MRWVSVVMLAVVLAGPLQAGEKKSRKRVFWLSVAAVGIAAALDVHSSWGKAELNPLARASNGRLGLRGAGIKVAIAGGMIGFEYLLMKNQPDSELAASAVNFAVSGVWTGVAIRNYRIQTPPASWRPHSGPKPIGVPAAIP